MIKSVTEHNQETNNINDNDHIARRLTYKQTDFMTVDKSLCLNMRRRMLLYCRTTKIDRFYFQIHQVCVNSNNPNIYSKTSQQTFSSDIFGIYNFEEDD